jgi:hypothetical protein
VIPNQYKEERTMTSEIDNPETPKEKNDSGVSEVREQQTIHRIADKLSKRAAATERRYDAEHDIFTK